jgi:hypothetical protein
MINNRKIIIDVNCEVYKEIKQYADEEFVTLDTHSVVYNAIYLISQHQFTLNTTKIRELIVTHNIIPFLSNPAGQSTSSTAYCTSGHRPLYTRSCKFLKGML